MFNIVLFNPQIPQNTGNIARTCAVTNSALHLIKPYGFNLTEKNVKRAGLDYWDNVTIFEYNDFEEFIEEKNSESQLFLVTTKGDKKYSDVRYNDNDYFIFGSETTGLPQYIHQQYYQDRLRIPMLDIKAARCLNLSNSVNIVLYEALRQNQFLTLK